MRQVTFLLSLCLVCLTALAPQRAFGLAEAADLNLDGASVTDLAQGGGIVYAATEGPRGIFTSNDFGASWRFAAGGAYTSGEGRAVRVFGNRVFAVLGGKVYSASHSLTPQWSELALNLSPGSGSGNFLDPERVTAVTGTDAYLFIASNYGKVYTLRLSDATVVSSSVLPSVTSPTFIERIAVLTASNTVLVHRGIRGQAESRILATTFSTATGTLSEWEDRTPARLRGDGARIGGVFSNGADIAYLTTFGAGEQSRGIYRTVNSGNNWSRVLGETGDGATYNIAAVAFQGSTHLIGDFLSRDSGETFTRITMQSSRGVVANRLASLLDSNTTDRLMTTSPLGPLTIQDIDDASGSDFQESFRGLRGLLVNDMAQSDDLGVTVLALPGGIARSLNFAAGPGRVGYEYPILPEINGSKVSTSVFAVAVDPDNPAVTYVGTGDLLRAQFTSASSATWTRWDVSPGPAFNVSDIVVTGNRVVVASAQTAGGLNGRVRVFDRATGILLATGMSGMPVSALAAASEQVLFAGVGGIDTLEAGGRSSSNRGLYRSLDGGTTWVKISGNSRLNVAGVAALAYDSVSDTLYVAGNGFRADSGDGAPIEPGDLDESGTVFTIKKASARVPQVSMPQRGLPDDSAVRAVTVALKDGSQQVFAASENRLYVTNSSGETWALLFEGLTGEETNLLFFDDLVRGSNAGFDAIQGKPRLIVSTVTRQVKGRSKKALDIKLSKEFEDSAANRRNVQVRASGVKARISKRNAITLRASPIGSWPNRGKVRVTVKPSFRAQEGDAIDTDYDGAEGGTTFRVTVAIKQTKKP